jgi:hypothetical protein
MASMLDRMRWIGLVNAWHQDGIRSVDMRMQLQWHSVRSVGFWIADCSGNRFWQSTKVAQWKASTIGQYPEVESVDLAGMKQWPAMASVLE